MAAAEALAAEGRRVRVVSLPCFERFFSQPTEYIAAVLGQPSVPRLAVEAGVSQPWWRLVGPAGSVIAQESFGASAPWTDLAEHFGFTTDRVLAEAREILGVPAEAVPHS
jgi:transketolase